MPRGRPTTAQERALMIEKFAQSKLTKAEFCIQFGLAQSTLYAALKKERGRVEQNSDFCPVVIAPNCPKPTELRSVITINSCKNFVIEIPISGNSVFVTEILRSIL
jgi:hypothetical protein